MPRVFDVADDLTKLSRATDIQFSRGVGERGRTHFDNDLHWQFLFPIKKRKAKDFFDYLI